MPGKLKPTSIISSPLFNRTSSLTHEDFLSLSVAGYGKPAEHLLNDLNWSKEVICITGLKLAPDNLRVINSSVFLIGALLKDKRVNITNYWPFTSPTSLTISIPDSTVFQFNNGALYSDYVNSTAFVFSFSQNSSTPSEDFLSAAGFKGFCLRALLMPISVAYTKLWITLFPCPLDSLFVDFPLAPAPSFPGFKLLEGDIPLGPSCSGPPLSKDWGFPLCPALILGSDLTPEDPTPAPSTLISALCAMLSKAVRPEICAKLSTLADRLALLATHGSSQLKDLNLEFSWPRIQPRAQSNFPPDILSEGNLFV